LDVVSRGLRIPHPVPTLPILKLDALAEKAADTLWAAPQIHGRKVVAMFVSGTFDHKKWPLDRYATVVNWLNARGICVLLVGGEADRIISRQMAMTLSDSRVVDVTGQTSLSELAAILRRCTAFVGNDGGPAHLAAINGVPCVTVMSGVHCVGMWDPSGAQNVAVRHVTACYSCKNEFTCPTGTRACIEGISTDDVIRACETALRCARYSSHLEKDSSQ
jgi:ADP-heptose:LPS heptosyltransferase